VTKLATAFIAATLAFAAPAHATATLPECNNDEVQQVLTRLTKALKIFETKDMRSGEGQRWCYVYFGGIVGYGGNPFQEVIFTLEWINESEGRWWLQIKERRETCRGNTGDPTDMSRCQQ
jgi:hypothetical protein